MGLRSSATRASLIRSFSCGGCAGGSLWIAFRAVAWSFSSIFAGAPQRSYWLLIDPSDVSVCLKRAQFRRRCDRDRRNHEHSTRSGSAARPWSDAMRKNLVLLDGAPADIRAFPTWFTWSPMAETVRSALADRRTASRRAISTNSPSMRSALGGSTRSRDGSGDRCGVKNSTASASSRILDAGKPINHRAAGATLASIAGELRWMSR